MIPNLALQEIHDTMPSRRSTDWQELWERRGATLIRLVAELEETRRQRDMLAQRCAEQAKQLEALISPFSPTPRDVVGEAIRKMQDGGIR